MALMSCPDCGKSFSDTAAACPDCGYQAIHRDSTDEALIANLGPMYMIFSDSMDIIGWKGILLGLSIGLLLAIYT